MKKLLFICTLLIVCAGANAQIKILNKIIDRLPTQPKDFKIWLDTTYKNPIDNTTETTIPAGAPRTTAVIEYGDGTFGELFNQDNSNAIKNGQIALAVVTTYYDTIDKPKGTIRMFQTTTEATGNVASTQNIPSGKLLKLIPYARNTILYDNKKRKLKDTFFAALAYKNVPGVIAVYFNEKNDKYFTITSRLNNNMWMYNLNTRNQDSISVPIIRKYYNEQLFYSTDALISAYPMYASKRDHFNFGLVSSPEYKNVVFIKTQTTATAEKNIFLSLLPIPDEASYRISGDSTTTIKAVFFNDDSLFSTANVTPQSFFSDKGPSANYNDMTEQRLSLTARDPNSLTANPSCIVNIDEQREVNYKLLFYNDGAGTANNIQINLVPNSKLILSSIDFSTLRLGPKIFTNIPYYETGGANPPPVYYTRSTCPYTFKNWLGHIVTEMRPCAKVILKNVNLRGTFQTSLSGMDSTKSIINFKMTTNTSSIVPELTAGIYFNDASVPLTIKRKIDECRRTELIDSYQ